MFTTTKIAALSALASTTVANLWVIEPPDLKSQWDRSEGMIPSKMGNFGFIQQGSSLMGTVIFPSDTNFYGCDPFSDDDFYSNKGTKNIVRDKTNGKVDNHIMMVKRGGCSFPKKIRNAQDYGATCIIVGDYDDDDEMNMPYDNIMEQEYDGSLSSHIPLFEITARAYRTIEGTITKRGETVHLKATMDVSTDDNSVEVDYWYSTSLDLGLKLANEFTALSYSFSSDHNKKPLFTPRIASYSCTECPDEMKEKNCVSNGKYCAYEPRFQEAFNLDQDEEFQLTGRGVIIQALREKCLHKIITEKYEDEGVLFWTFFNYLEQCFEEDDAMGYRRAHNVTNLASCYDWSTVNIENNEEVGTLNECVDGSFMIRNNLESDNTILSEDMQWAQEHNLNYHPSVTINSITYKGEITGQDLAMAICAAYKERPDECDLSWKIQTFQQGLMDKMDAEVGLPTENDDMLNMALKYMNNTEAQNIGDGTKIQMGHLYVVLFIIVGVNLICLLAVRNYMQRQTNTEVNTQVNDAVNKYFALSAKEPDQP